MPSRDHYQSAFEKYVRERRLPYVSVDEARRALLPGGGVLALPGNTTIPVEAATLKSFDFVVYGPGSNLLVEVKGRKIASRRTPSARRAAGSNQADKRPPVLAARDSIDRSRPKRTRLDSWVTQDDVESLKVWADLFGAGFTAVFAFVYWCEELPPSALFEDYVQDGGRWYAIRCVDRDAYERAMRPRSPKWRTVHVPPDSFDRLSRPLTGPTPELAG